MAVHIPRFKKFALLDPEKRGIIPRFSKRRYCGFNEARDKRSGFSLLEILIALIIFTTGIVAIMGLFSQGLVGSVDEENTGIAVTLAQQRLEEIRNLDFDTGVVSEVKAAVAGFPGFQREVIVTQPQTDLKQLVVNTYWTDKSGEVSTSLTTYISRN
jgi:prepilin-type N-terminal cleavage/methylation domain-containing protein